MTFNLSDCFENGFQLYLKSIDYKHIEEDPNEQAMELNVNDNIQAERKKEFVRVEVTRKLTFNPNALFSLEVTYGAILRVNENGGKILTDGVDLSEEFRKQGDFVLNNLFSRMSLLIASITSSQGQMPIVLPPQFA